MDQDFRLVLAEGAAALPVASAEASHFHWAVDEV